MSEAYGNQLGVGGEFERLKYWANSGELHCVTPYFFGNGTSAQPWARRTSWVRTSPTRRLPSGERRVGRFGARVMTASVPCRPDERQAQNGGPDRSTNYLFYLFRRGGSYVAGRAMLR
jgi:hypothetical protein